MLLLGAPSGLRGASEKGLLGGKDILRGCDLSGPTL